MATQIFEWNLICYNITRLYANLLYAPLATRARADDHLFICLFFTSSCLKLFHNYEASIVLSFEPVQQCAVTTVNIQRSILYTCYEYLTDLSENSYYCNSLYRPSMLFSHMQTTSLARNWTTPSRYTLVALNQGAPPEKCAQYFKYMAVCS